MRRLFLILLLIITPALFAQVDQSGGSAAHGAASEAHEETHGEQAAGGHGEKHEEKLYFGFMPGWILKTLNMIAFVGVLVWLARGPVRKAFAERSEAIRRANEEARERRVKADQMASDIQARLAAIEAEVRAIHERAQSEGERQKRELVAAAEAESQKILTAARTEVDNRLKHARSELTEYAGQLAAERAEQILREKINEQDQKKLFQESLREVSEVRG
ncbi:MAG TPA: ATP synthase F0 subunit B [Thermoanaerobaculia bacterium]|nr:ATP synthase F0 subunit B [Thermoanaerobaculia bacterium]